MASEYLNNKKLESVINSFQRCKRQKVKYDLMIKERRATRERRAAVYRDSGGQEFLEEAERLRREACSLHDEFQEQLAYAFYVLSENLANWAKFKGVDTDDAVQEGVLICFEKIDRFDPRKGKAFNYMTTCILNHYRQIYRSTRNYNELKKRYHTHLKDKFETTFFRNGKERSQNSQLQDNNA